MISGLWPGRWGVLGWTAGEHVCVSDTGTKQRLWVQRLRERRVREMLLAQWLWYVLLVPPQPMCPGSWSLPTGSRDRYRWEHPGPDLGSAGVSTGKAPPQQPCSLLPLVPRGRDAGVLLRPPGAAAGTQPGHKLRRLPRLPLSRARLPHEPGGTVSWWGAVPAHGVARALRGLRLAGADEVGGQDALGEMGSRCPSGSCSRVSPTTWPSGRNCVAGIIMGCPLIRGVLDECHSVAKMTTNQKYLLLFLQEGKKE